MRKSRAVLILVVAPFILAACGLAETAATSATVGKSAAEQAKEAKDIQEGVQADLDAAQAEARRQRDAAEAASQ